MISRDLRDQLGQNLRRYRERADLSQEELSMRASLHRTAVGQLERGERIARADTLIKLAGALKVPAGNLLDGIAWESGYFHEGRFGFAVGERVEAGGEG